MLARIAVHLPVSLWAPENAPLEPFEAMHRQETIVIYPPLQCPFEIRPDQEGNFNVNDIYRMLTPTTTPRVYPFVRMDEQFVKHVNLLQVDFKRATFDRTSGAAADPSRELIEEVVTNVLARLRYAIGAADFREIRLHETFWTIRYLADDGTELPEEQGLVRGRVNAPFKFTFTGLDERSWAIVRKLSFSFEPQIWQRLFLDAQFLLPEIGPALTVAVSAVETAADAMIHDRMKPDVGGAEKIIGTHRLAQRLDVVAKKLAGVSLKDKPALWNAFNELRRARNAAAHEGAPVLDGAVVTEEAALKMIMAVSPVLDWIESHMDLHLRSVRDRHEPKWEWRSPVHSSESHQ